MELYRDEKGAVDLVEIITKALQDAEVIVNSKGETRDDVYRDIQDLRDMKKALEIFGEKGIVLNDRDIKLISRWYDFKLPTYEECQRLIAASRKMYEERSCKLK